MPLTAGSRASPIQRAAPDSKIISDMAMPASTMALSASKCLKRTPSKIIHAISGTAEAMSAPTTPKWPIVILYASAGNATFTTNASP
jgi:CheY-like chemotaxis protein